MFLMALVASWYYAAMKDRIRQIEWWRWLAAVPGAAGILYVLIRVFSGPQVFEDYEYALFLLVSPFVAMAFGLSAYMSLKGRGWVGMLLGSVLPVVLALTAIILLSHVFP